MFTSTTRILPILWLPILWLQALTVIAASLLPGTPAVADPNKLAHGKHLAQECTSCHRLDGTDKGIPSIIGLKPDYFVATMKFYKTGERTNAVMNSVAQMLNDEQLEALAAYFETQKPPPKPSPTRKK